jgi:hypothetical protein
VLLDRSTAEVGRVSFGAPASHIDIVDVEGDGVCEFMNRGSWGDDAWLKGHSGEGLWVYGGADAVDDACAGDIDGDGALEFAVGFNGPGGIHLLDTDGHVLWREADSNVWHVEMADTDDDGSLDVIHSSSEWGLTIRGRDGSILQENRGIANFYKFSLCRWPGSSDAQHLVTCGDGRIAIVDFEGQIVARLDAPAAHHLGEARAASVKLDPGAPALFAVLVDFRSWGRSALYLYDGEGTLAYHEVLGERSAAIASAPAGDSGAEALLVGGEDRVWRYRIGTSARERRGRD